MTEIEDRRSTTALVTVLDIVIGERRWGRSEPDRSPASSINSTRATSRRHTRTAYTADTNIRYLPLFYLQDNIRNESPTLLILFLGVDNIGSRSVHRQNTI